MIMPPQPTVTRTTLRLLSLSNHIAVRPSFSAKRPAFSPSALSMSTSSKSSSPSPGPSSPNSTGNQGVEYNFPISPIPKNSLGEGKFIQTAAALIIGDEILNGKTLDRNSNYFARYCFEQGIELKRIEVIADDEDEIIEASRRMVQQYDLVITSGGIGPTHDDITYASLAKSFNQSLIHHSETLSRMAEMNKHRPWVATQNADQRTATHRMALFPGRAEVLFIAKDIWVPVVRLEGKLCIFPGIPSLFQKMLNGLTPFLPLPPRNQRPHRMQVFTSRPESMIAPYLTSLQAELKPHAIQVGSYPVLGQGVYVSLIGRDLGKVKEAALEVEVEVGGKIFSEEEVIRKKSGILRKSSFGSDTTGSGSGGETINRTDGSSVKVEV